jgi:hypothetical protein
VQGVNGSGNYSYELRALGGGGNPLLPANTTGVFAYGAVGQSFTVKVIDTQCNTSFSQNVSLLDLSDAQITYSASTDNVFCEGQDLQLRCVTLGSTQYSWTGPNGWTSNEQNPVRANSTPAMSGTYTVTVTPEGCATPMTQQIDIIVSPCMAVVNPHLRTRVR